MQKKNPHKVVFTGYEVTNLDDLSTRAQNIVHDLGGLEETLEYYKSGKSFLSIRNAGKLVDAELCSLCTYLLKANGEQAIDNNQDPLNYDNLNEQKVEELLPYYKSTKKTLSTRASNFLHKFEMENSFQHSNENEIEFLKQIILTSEENSKKRKPGIGQKTITEISNFFSTIRNNYLDNTFFFSNPPLKKDIISISRELGIKGERLNEIIEFVSTQPELNLDTLLLLAYNYGASEKQNSIARKLFFEPKILSNSEIAKKLKVSIPTISLLKTDVEHSFLPSLKNWMREINSELPMLKIEKINDFQTFENLEPIIINESTIHPNFNFCRAFIKVRIEEYALTQFELFKKLHQNLAYKIDQKIIGISHSFIDQTHLSELIIFLNDQIYQFESMDFDYNLRVLISRFYSESKLKISELELDKIELFIREIKRTDILPNAQKIKSLEKNALKTRIEEMVVEFLATQTIGQKTEVILNHLQLNGIDAEKQQLLKILGNRMGEISRFGNGVWGLKKWSNSYSETGSIRDIVLKLLTESSVPLHISQLLDTIQLTRIINEHSLLSNLHAAEKGKFKFFNCMFIGLAEKKYPDSYSKIPKLSGAHFRGEEFRKHKKKSTGALLNYLQKKYGYPEIHIKYILNLSIPEQQELNFEDTIT